MLYQLQDALKRTMVDWKQNGYDVSEEDVDTLIDDAVGNLCDELCEEGDLDQFVGIAAEELYKKDKDEVLAYIREFR